MSEDGDGRSDPTVEAEQVFAEYLAQRLAGTDVDLEPVCVAHPHLVGELRALLAEWETYATDLQRMGIVSGSLSQRLQRRYGSEAMPQLSLHGETPSETARSAAHTKSPVGNVGDDIYERLAAGSIPERYTVQREVARGGMGLVLQVWDDELRRELAMKVLLSEPAASLSRGQGIDGPRRLYRFLNEAQLTSQLDHPGIVPVHELGLDADGRPFFTMKLVKGRTLQSVLDQVAEGQQGWTRVRVLGVLLKVCEAMAYAHDKGVVHRDLKPSNIMVGAFAEVYVMDWGLARVLDSADAEVGHGPAAAADHPGTSSPPDPLRTREGDVLGTPVYMSPEQADGDLEQVGPRSDVYAMGAMLYHLLSGNAPYLHEEHSDSYTVWRRLREGPPAPLQQVATDVPAELAAICEQAMTREPGQRYPDMAALAADLAASLEGRVVRAYETGAVAELRLWMRRNRSLAGALAGAVLLLVAGLVTSLILKGQADRSAESERSERSNVLRLSAFQTLEGLRTSADVLWPALPERASDYRRWIDEALRLQAGLETHLDAEGRSIVGHREQLTILRSRAQGSVSRSDGLPRLATDETLWWTLQLQRLVSAIEDFADPATGLWRGTSPTQGWGIEWRLEFATSIVERSIGSAEMAKRWDEAAAAIAADPRFGGLRLVPQVGLVPLGADPDSGLWEFAQLQTGTPPTRDKRGQLAIAAETGLVFVLLPGGTFSMGAQRLSAGRPHYDPAADDHEGPVRDETVPPFLLSKYEMTSGQWKRFAGNDPSHFGPHNTSPEWSGDGLPVDARHPVEEVTWIVAMSTLQRMGLELPTEAHWEYAARAGSDTPWWTGPDKGRLAMAANVGDQYCSNHGGTAGTFYEAWNDGYTVHAPVGSFDANPLGLHDMHGNVWEWCRDAFIDQADGRPSPLIIARPEDTPSAYSVYRGGSFDYPAIAARVSLRAWGMLDYSSFNLGLRPMRELDD